MTTRTFIQEAAAYGATAVTVTASINGAQVFSGNVEPVGSAIPSDQTAVPFANLFTWTNTVDFAGTSFMTITVENGDLLLGDSFANYAAGNSQINPAQGNVDSYLGFYDFTIDGNTISDPLSDVFIDSIGQSTDRSTGLYGQWYWTIPAGSTFSATVNIEAGSEPTV